MPPSAIHLLTGPPADLPAATVACGSRDAALGTWNPDQVTCPGCQRGPCTCGPGVPLCPHCARWNRQHRRGPTRLPPLQTEKALQAWVQQQAVSAGWLYYHTTDSRHSPAGFPDTVLCRGEQLIIAELKMRGKHPTPPQQMWLDALRQVTQTATYVWMPDDLDTILEVLR